MYGLPVKPNVSCSQGLLRRGTEKHTARDLNHWRLFEIYLAHKGKSSLFDRFKSDNRNIENNRRAREKMHRTITVTMLRFSRSSKQSVFLRFTFASACS
jgi:hypothetical protein